ncbi:LPXTG cell wall anchor domain-containing protein [Corynebacterium otitidis]|uniref:LPXTG-domain-containing protein cell wall anchor domain n=1 Tax=Corynebacterium otitidis ATCC 51513 TaxID=883169 RepID=K0YET9_9CORY|nr:LPXTG cell wall anchor domain-containing protein [Corynebacterium otitidis]EJZ82027.1 LPXTG-domain-containing protein cell wall anchor domain [Corynebacterium otitidis ATCC 51513]
MASLSKKTLAGAAASAVALAGLAVAAPQAIAQENNNAVADNSQAPHSDFKLAAEALNNSGPDEKRVDHRQVGIRFTWSGLDTGALSDSDNVTFAIIPADAPSSGIRAKEHRSIVADINDLRPRGDGSFGANGGAIVGDINWGVKPNDVVGAHDIDIIAWIGPGESSDENLLGRAPVELGELDRAILGLEEPSLRGQYAPEGEAEAPEGEDNSPKGETEAPTEESNQQQVPEAEQPSTNSASAPVQQVSSGQPAPAPARTASNQQGVLANTGASVAGVAALGGVALMIGLGVLALRRRNA